MIYSNPGTKSYYPSTVVSPWYCWFLEMGYQNLDIEKYQDGSWSIIEYYNAPVIPSMTRYNLVLGPMENVDITKGFVYNWVKKLDLRRKEYWDECEKKTQEMEDEKARLEAHAQDTADRATKAIMGNESLVNRIAKRGMKEIDLTNIRRNIPRHQLIRG